jgi:hypothetical protein
MSCPACSHNHSNVYNAVACYLGLPLARVTPQPPTVVAPASPLPRRSWESEVAYARRVERWHAERARSHALLGMKEEGGGRVVQAAPLTPSSAPAVSGTSITVLPDASVQPISSGRAGRSGRPRVSVVEQQRKAREHSRTYRARRKAAQIAQAVGDPGGRGR